MLNFLTGNGIEDMAGLEEKVMAMYGEQHGISPQTAICHSQGTFSTFFCLYFSHHKQHQPSPKHPTTSVAVRPASARAAR